MRRRLLTLLFAAIPSLPLPAGSLEQYLSTTGKPPAEYVLSKLADHRIVILGEAHWQLDDVELVKKLLPDLRAKSVVFALEMFQADRQADIDKLLAAPEWDSKLANDILHSSYWPYVEYREILETAWRVNREASTSPPLRVVAIGPPYDFREKKIRYDVFMVDHLLNAMAPESRALAYVGMHHAFTRYLQIDRRENGRPSAFIDRFGNILWRRFAENVFLIALHKPDWCGPVGEGETVLCPPFSGRIDCAALTVGKPIGFDILESPIAELKVPDASFYASGHPFVRLIDYADGYIWMGPIDELRLVDRIPLAEWSPEAIANEDEVAKWQKRVEDLAHPYARPSWKKLQGWRSTCGVETSSHHE